MPKHLFAETIFTQPTCVIDLIQSYALWAEKNISNRTVAIVRDMNEEAVEYIEEYVIENTHMVTVKTVVYPKNPSIVILETIGGTDILDSKVNMIINDYDQTYLLLDKAIKITAGRNLITDMPGNDQSDPTNPNDPETTPGYNETLSHSDYSVNWSNSADSFVNVYVNHTGNLNTWSQVGTMNWNQKVYQGQNGGYEVIFGNIDTNETIKFHTDGTTTNIQNMQKQITQSIPGYGAELETYYPE